MKTSNLLAFAVLEFNENRRHLRPWVFAGAALIIVMITWFSVRASHSLLAISSASGSVAGSHFFPVAIGSTFLCLLSIGTVFLTFDFCHRDKRERIEDAMNSRPFTNLEFVLGRLLGSVAIMTLFAVLITTALFLVGVWMDPISGSLQSAFNLLSVLSFLTWDLLPNLILWGSASVALSFVLRIRPLVLLLMLCLVSGYYFLSRGLPISLASGLCIYQGIDVIPSELAHRFVTWEILVNRVAVLLLSLGFIGLAASVHNRSQPKNRRMQIALATGTLSAIALFGITGLIYARENENLQVQRWSSVHAEHQSHSATDILKLSGTVTVVPGRQLSLDLNIVLNAATESQEDFWLLSLNPGYRIANLFLNDVELHRDQFKFEDGLLTLHKPDDVPPHAVVRLNAQGVPKPSFAYLDSALGWDELNLVQARNLFRIGRESYIFHPNFVVLVPGVDWLPSSGAAFGRDNSVARPRDFYELDLEVIVPKDWLVAGPGRRELSIAERNSKQSFNPPNPVHEVALIASEFQQRSFMVEDIEFELLLSKRHMSRLQLWKAAVPELKEWIEDSLQLMQNAGLNYPFETLSFVEVPSSFRTYGGGWKMESTYSAPGVQMLRESSFQSTKSHTGINTTMSTFHGSEGDSSQVALAVLTEFFGNDSNGGSPFLGLQKQFANFQTVPYGSGSIALDYVVDELTRQLYTGVESYFSPYSSLFTHHFSNFGLSLVAIWRLSNPQTAKVSYRAPWVNQTNVWDKLQDTPVATMSPAETPYLAHLVLLKKCGDTARSMVDILGKERASRFIAVLVDRHRGSTYTEEEFLQAAREVGFDFDTVLGNWLYRTDLPGYVHTEPTLERLSDTELGEPVYQASFNLRNMEDTVGYVGISFSSMGGPHVQANEGRLLRIEGRSSVQMALGSNSPITSIHIDPYLSLNRGLIVLDVPQKESYPVSQSPKLPLLKKVDWSPFDGDIVIIDDLDNGFSIVGENQRNQGTLQQAKLLQTHELLNTHDQGLPALVLYLLETSKSPFYWYRVKHAGAFGLYRETFAFLPNGSEESMAKFSASLPHSGAWKLLYHSPKDSTERTAFGIPSQLGTHPITVVWDSQSHRIEFDADQADQGWNEIGEFDIDSLEVEVIVSSDGQNPVIADAIQWQAMGLEN